MPVAVMLSSMPASELTEWMAFFALENRDDEPEKPDLAEQLKAALAMYPRT